MREFSPEIESGNDEPALAGSELPSGLREDHRNLAIEHGWQDTTAVFEGYQALREQLAGAVHLPGEDADDDEQSAFYSDISKSWTPKDGYRFELPDNLPENFPYDQAFAEEAGNWFLEAGLHPKAAQQLHDKWVGKMASQFTAHEEATTSSALAQEQAAEAAHRDLVQDFGPPEGDRYQNAVAQADRALSGLKNAGIDLTDWFAEKGALSHADRNGLLQVTDPVAVKLLTFIHDRAFAEDGFSGLGEGPGGANPFDADNLDLRQQSELLDRNPVQARRMIVSAGRDPKLFGV